MRSIFLALFLIIFPNSAFSSERDQLAIYRVETEIYLGTKLLGKPAFRAIEGAETSAIYEGSPGYAYRFVINSDASKFDSLRWQEAAVNSELLTFANGAWASSGKPGFRLRESKQAIVESIGAAGPYKLVIRYDVTPDPHPVLT